jgi:glutaredoxin-like protein NrdH
LNIQKGNNYDAKNVDSYMFRLNCNYKGKEGKMEIIKVPGKNNKHKVLLYAISTCAWCKRAKRFLTENNIEYEYVDVDVCNREDREKIRDAILGRGGRLSYPTVIVDNRILITGFNEGQLREALEI